LAREVEIVKRSSERYIENRSEEMLDSGIEERWCAQPWVVLMHAFIQSAMLKSWR
jgi:hypothetical protein